MARVLAPLRPEACPELHKDEPDHSAVPPLLQPSTEALPRRTYPQLAAVPRGEASRAAFTVYAWSFNFLPLFFHRLWVLGSFPPPPFNNILPAAAASCRAVRAVSTLTRLSAQD